MIRLALLRHGHTAWNRSGRLQGRTDMPLDDAAKEELRQQRLPAPWDQADLWASPLSRARETAQIIAGRKPKVHEALIEMNWGDFEGEKRIDLFEDPNADYQHVETWGWTYTPPNGEAIGAVRDRVVGWAEGLSGDHVAVCHIGVMRALLAHATGWAFDGPAPFQIKRNRLYLIEIDRGKWSAQPEPARLQRLDV